MYSARGRSLSVHTLCDAALIYRVREFYERPHVRSSLHNLQQRPLSPRACRGALRNASRIRGGAPLTASARLKLQRFNRHPRPQPPTCKSERGRASLARRSREVFRPGAWPLGRVPPRALMLPDCHSAMRRGGTSARRSEAG
ncbi:uncharacterized protein B0H18DRAFT_604712 [Fomitopsis serialis]|uniref:uncharacterized protein n=1 Tax=Fomitopsis serialis TaxID=139415 RepID=UPI0020076A9D|nr:uncharacterized protein B0H18DRAFT_604712 [Neoantrodia serialis]KAH9933891.1 hypothetical protein B0H18DRAFT_604712 [Neoantrodia serialis]